VFLSLSLSLTSFLSFFLCFFPPLVEFSSQRLEAKETHNPEESSRTATMAADDGEDWAAMDEHAGRADGGGDAANEHDVDPGADTSRARAQTTYKDAHDEVPEGFELEFTNKGVPFLRRIDGESSEEDLVGDDEAMNEHKIDKLPLFVHLDEIEKRFGFGTRIYFNFLKFVMVTNTVLTVFAGIHYIAYLGMRPEGEFGAKDLFVSAYPNDMLATWMTFSIFAIVAWFCFPAVYWFYITRRIEKEHFQDHDNEYAFSGMGMDLIKENQHFTSTERFVRRTISYGAALLLLGISVLATYFIQQWGNTKAEAGNILNLWNYFVAGTVALVNFIFQFISRPMTALEKHKTWAVFRKHSAIKMITFKLVNVTAMYAAKAFAFVEAGEARCGLEDMGSQFLAIIIMDAVVMSIVEMITPVLRSWAFKIVGIGSAGSDEDQKPEFDVSEEYLELFYRQFIIYVGMSVFPMITLLGTIANVLEYPQDKFRMLRICQRPKRLNVTMKKFLTTYLAVVAVVSMLAWPQGAVWVLGAHRDQRTQFWCCALLPGDPPDEANCTNLD
jgi:Calcium-activated chloride channel